jgi:hypothetical protein
MTKPRKAIEHALSPPPARGPQPIPISGAEVARAKEALLKERADDAAQAAADYKAEQDALRAKTALASPPACQEGSWAARKEIEVSIASAVSPPPADAGM